MALEMRGECERCRQALAHEDVAFVCSLECTYCMECAEVLGGICDNCSGELTRRPRRRIARTTPTSAAVARSVSLEAFGPSTPTPATDR